MDTKREIAVLMTVHNRKNLTVECLRHLYDNFVGGCHVRVFLVDDGSTDGTSEAVKRAFDDIVVIPGTGNLFWNRGMLMAWKAAEKYTPDFYLWLNDDTILYADALKNMLEAYMQVKPMSILSGAIMSKDGKTTSYGGWRGKKITAPDNTVQSVERINGNVVLVPQCVCKEIGMLDGYFRHSYGDWEYGVRARKQGIGLYITPSYVGRCDRHAHVDKCFDREVPFAERLRHLFSPLGHRPDEVFRYKLKAEGFIGAVKSTLAVMVATVYPH